MEGNLVCENEIIFHSCGAWARLSSAFDQKENVRFQTRKIYSSILTQFLFGFLTKG